MSESDSRPPGPPSEDAGLKGERRPIWAEFSEYLMENKKWWLIPILLVILLFMAILILSVSPVGPAIYTIF